jgi:PAS domain S-box-containing protein
MKRFAHIDRAPGARKLETQVVLLSVAAAMLAWVMQALLDFYFHYWGDVTYPQLLLLKIPPREIYSRVAITASFLIAGVIISRVVRRAENAEAQWENLYSSLRALREVNYLITHVNDRLGILQGVCEKLVEHRGFGRAAIALSAPYQSIAAEVNGARSSPDLDEAVVIPLRCGGELLGQLEATLPAGLAADADERGFLEEVADDVAFALRSVRIDEERERRTAVQQALYQVAAGLRAARTREDIPEIIRYGLSDVLNTRNLRVTLLERDAKTLRELRPLEDAGRPNQESGPAAGTLTGLVARTGIGRKLEAVDIERLVATGLIAGGEDLPAVWVGAPIEVDREVRGVLSLELVPGEFAGPDDTLDILTFVADQLGECLSGREAEQAIREQRQQLQTILDTVPAYISYKDSDGRYLRVNRALADMAGIAEPKWIGKTFQELLPDASGGMDWNDGEVIRTGEPRLGSLEVIEIDDKMHWLQTDRIPYRDGAGGVAGVIGFSVDITERREMEAALIIKEEELRQSQKMEAIGLLAGGIAHDFNNLLTAILGYAELSLAGADPSDPIVKSLSGIREAAGRAAALTRQLLAFSRRQALQLAAVDLSDVVENIRSMLGRLIGEDIELVTRGAPSVPIIRADPAQIEQIIVNLAVNARDAMPDGGTLTISTECTVLDEESCQRMSQGRPGRFACLTVRDTGIGMSSEVLAHIFEPFYTTKGPQAGTGLGLSVIYGNVQQHDGWIDVDTGPGQGTTFRLFFPEADELPEADEQQPKPEEASECVGGRILLVEDEELIRDLAAKVLRSKGYQVVDVSTAEEALTHIDDEEDFDLIFSDVVLPGMSGVQLAEAVEQRCPDSRILLCSGYTDRRLQWPTICERRLPFLDKPYSVADLLASVRETLQ